MNRLIKVAIVALFPIYLYSHSLVLNLMDNEDGTITASGMFNTGESAAGAMVRILAIESQEILYEKRLPENSELTIPIPKVAYTVVLDGGPGHTVSKPGIEPQGGFIKEKMPKEGKNKKEQPSRTNMQISSSNAVTYSIIVAFLLLFATIFISIKNTNKLLQELKK
ncbi:hypothetical protein CRV08_05570 [Halarcobacter ebronensis]|uniref:Uncharacterized protein n=1 Tax=Halarcobacter ebronensis TaxID=1462615 RepID=A0A4Q0YEG1_9BACT|nr:hypothetical protein [Halarcobacter ebronensis]RXJ68906.1 hypothetical protein CRV08_05570 [Halarcobacter ebronensis]